MNNYLLKINTNIIISIMLYGCSFAPPERIPTMPIPKSFKETGKWIQITPTVKLHNHNWWQLFTDPQLNKLEQQVTCGNDNIKVAIARYQKSCAIAQAAYSASYPTIVGIANPVRQKNSVNIANANFSPAYLYNIFMLGANLTYEIDAWGKIRNTAKTAAKLAQANLFDLATIDLSMHTELAKNYFLLRGQLMMQDVLDRTIIAYRKAFIITRNRYKGGISTVDDVYQALTQLENAKTLATETRLKSAQLKHAIAVLIGEIPSNFNLTIHNRERIKLITISPDLPSTLLAHRPDVAARAAQVQAANAAIGVARAAFFPAFNLNLLLGLQSQQVSNLFNASSIFWSLGSPTTLTLVEPAINQIIFDGFKLQAQLKYAKASYYEAVSAYRQTALTAFQEVEDNLVALHRLDQEIITQQAATNAAYRALFQENQRYLGGISTFLDIVILENQALQAKLALIVLQTRRQIASVQLIKALGGNILENTKNM